MLYSYLSKMMKNVCANSKIDSILKFVCVMLTYLRIISCRNILSHYMIHDIMISSEKKVYFDDDSIKET